MPRVELGLALPQLHELQELHPWTSRELRGAQHRARSSTFREIHSVCYHEFQWMPILHSVFLPLHCRAIVLVSSSNNAELEPGFTVWHATPQLRIRKPRAEEVGLDTQPSMRPYWMRPFSACNQPTFHSCRANRSRLFIQYRCSGKQPSPDRVSQSVSKYLLVRPAQSQCMAQHICGSARVSYTGEGGHCSVPPHGASMQGSHWRLVLFSRPTYMRPAKSVLPPHLRMHRSDFGPKADGKCEGT